VTLLKQSRVKQNNWWALLVVMGGVFLSTMDSGMVNIAIPTIMRHFNLAIDKSALVVTTYLLTVTISLVFWGRIADRKGFAKVYLGGLFVFSIGAWLCYFTANFSLLLLSRFVQGVGASMMMATGPAIIKTSFPVARLGRNLGLVGIATACGLLTGPFVCGQLLTHFSWRSVFALLGLVSFMVFCVGFLLLSSKNEVQQRHYRGQFDWKGGLCWVVSVILVINLLQGLHQSLMIISVVKAIFLAGLLHCFIRVEKKASHPIVPLHLFKNRYYWVGVVTASLSFLSLFSVLVLVPFFLEYVLHYSSSQIGVTMMAVPATLIFLSPSAGYLYDKIGAKYLTSVGLFISCVALFGLAELSEVSSLFSVVAFLAMLGAGQSIFLAPNSASVLSRVGDLKAGITAGILATARNFGMVVGATVATVLFGYFSHGFAPEAGVTQLQNIDTTIIVLAFGSTLKCIAGSTFLASLISTLRQ
jgi:EmrB/QacA subfamily drug resistance transporter